VPLCRAMAFRKGMCVHHAIMLVLASNRPLARAACQELCLLVLSAVASIPVAVASLSLDKVSGSGKFLRAAYFGARRSRCLAAVPSAASARCKRIRPRSDRVSGQVRARAGARVMSLTIAEFVPNAGAQLQLSAHARPASEARSTGRRKAAR
jgi:hypothetical protein